MKLLKRKLLYNISRISLRIEYLSTPDKVEYEEMAGNFEVNENLSMNYMKRISGS